MDFKVMMLKCIQEDCRKGVDMANVCSVLNRYSQMSDTEIIKRYDEYFGLDSIEEGMMCNA